MAKRPCRTVAAALVQSNVARHGLYISISHTISGMLRVLFASRACPPIQLRFRRLDYMSPCPAQTSAGCIPKNGLGSARLLSVVLAAPLVGVCVPTVGERWSEACEVSARYSSAQDDIQIFLVLAIDTSLIRLSPVHCGLLPRFFVHHHVWRRCGVTPRYSRFIKWSMQPRFYILQQSRPRPM